MKEKIIELLYYVIHPTKQIDKVFNYRDVYPYFKFHHLEAFLEYARKQSLLVISEEETKELQKIYNTALYKTAIQEEELKVIKKTFDENNIKYLPLKGSLIRNTYPSPDLRSMADIDILIPKAQLKKAKLAMTSLAYKTIHIGGNHDVYHKLPFMNVELHREMIDESYALSRYYKNIWTKVIKKDDKSLEYILNNEDTYLFIVAHSAKHYYAGGTGIRSVLDIYFYLKEFPNMNTEYIKEELIKLDLSDYEKRMRDLAFAWFDNQELYEEIEQIAQFIIHSGVYGTTLNYVTAKLLPDEKSKSLRLRKLNYFFSRAFPKFSTMKKIHPILKYLPFLLPFFYITRLIKGIFKGIAINQTKQLIKIQDEDIQKYKDIKEKIRSK